LVYKKYVVKNGKRYGPYIYHSRRINGKVISEYHGQEKKFPKKIISILIIAFFLGGIIFLASLFKQNLSGNAIFGVEGEIQNGTVSSGRINFFLNEGELIPVNSTVKIINNEDTYEYSLEDFLGKSETFFGSFGLKDLKFSGEGEGYGLVGKKETFPLITFEVILKDKEKNEEGDLHFEKNGKETLTPPSEENVEKVEEIEGVNATEQSAEVNHSTVGIEVIPEIAEETFLEEKESLVEDNASSENAETELITETFSEPTAEETVLNEETTSVSEETNADVEIVQAEEKSAETNDETTTETEESGEEPDGETPLTGNFISVLANSISNLFAGLMTGRVTDSPKVIEGQVSKNSPFEFQNNGKIPEIVDGSIKISGEPVSANLLYLENFGNKTFVKTNYSVFEEGFGEGFFGIETKSSQLILQI